MNAHFRSAEHTTHLFWVVTGSDHQANSLTSKLLAAECADDGKPIADALEDITSGGVTQKDLGVDQQDVDMYAPLRAPATHLVRTPAVP